MGRLCLVTNHWFETSLPLVKWISLLLLLPESDPCTKYMLTLSCIKTFDNLFCALDDEYINKNTKTNRVVPGLFQEFPNSPTSDSNLLILSYKPEIYERNLSVQKRASKVTLSTLSRGKVLNNATNFWVTHSAFKHHNNGARSCSYIVAWPFNSSTFFLPR